MTKHTPTLDVVDPSPLPTLHRIEHGADGRLIFHTFQTDGTAGSFSVPGDTNGGIIRGYAVQEGSIQPPRRLFRLKAGPGTAPGRDWYAWIEDEDTPHLWHAFTGRLWQD
ncbi:hypothetical protein [Deinococcus sp.]|uniref:hypothetical protein n=1 Tax=Deinococcus sp. TaxID=47478 RepID=UPI003CC53403